MANDHSELVVALVAAVGTDVGLVAEQIATQLARFEYQSEVFRLSDYLAERAEESYDDRPFDEQLWAAMSEGDKLRQEWDRDDALALQAISDIVATRREKSGREIETGPGDSEPANLERFAFILRSLKTPDELETLRAVYGPRLVVIGAYSPIDKRLEHLAERIEDSRNERDPEQWVYRPEQLIARDEREEAVGGQDVSGTFHRADFFVRAWSREVIRSDLERVISILFGDPFRTPTRDEHAQFLAAGAALRSAEFGRQVGAAIATADGSVIALGSNEVPSFRGGSPWEGDGPKTRDFEVGDRDTNREHLEALAKQLTLSVERRLRKASDDGETSGEGAGGELPESVIEDVLHELPGDLRAGGLKDLTEFGRATHAEMNALLDAARRGVPVVDSTLHTTTFPCHNCARHIIAAGVRRVVFIEPYAKSRAGALHDDAISVDQSNPGDRVDFQPFVGVSPRRYLEMFDAEGRKRLGHVARADSEGRKQELDRASAQPVFVDAGLEQFRPELPGYRAKELLALDHFDRLSEERDDDPSEAAGTSSKDESDKRREEDADG
jgi:deoxycytidylate deaminase